ncbi:MAG: protein kinase [Deltaproteobacteria bacterium]|nr:protein kinase [Deltaproteobacteria bacterium]
MNAEMFCPACGRSFAEGTVSCSDDGAQLVRIAERSDPLIGRSMLGRFEIREKLGEGGMGVVYRGAQLSLGRDVAIKLIRPSPADNRDATKRFLREAKLATQISNPHTVSVLDFGQTEDGLLFLVMELLSGETLATRLSTAGPLAVSVAVPILCQICEALGAAHRVGVVHRDLKPANVFLLDRDFVKVLDFGMAKAAGDQGVTSSGLVVGTPAYIAPEVALGRPAQPAADLYSLGIVAYELLSGSVPFLGDTPGSTLMQHVNEVAAPLPDEVPPAIRRIIETLLEKDPERRLPSAEATRAALEAAHVGSLAIGVAATVRTPSLSPRALGAVSPPSDTGRHEPASLPPPSLLASGEARFGQSHTRLVLAGALLLGAVVWGALSGLMGRTAEVIEVSPAPQPSSATPRPPELLSPRPTPAPTASVDVKPSIASTHLELESTPPALVIRNGEAVGTTPIRLSSDDRAGPISLELKAKGFVSKSIVWDPKESRKESVRLAKSAASSGTELPF